MPQVGGSCPGCFGEVDMNEIEIIDDIKAVTAAQSGTLIIGNLDPNCRLKLDFLTNFKSQVGTYSPKFKTGFLNKLQVLQPEYLQCTSHTYLFTQPTLDLLYPRGPVLTFNSFSHLLGKIQK